MKLYVDPINYWKDGYNLLDVIIIVTIFIPYGLHRFKGKHYPYLNIADGMQSLRILKLITYSRGIRVSDLGLLWAGGAGRGACLPTSPRGNNLSPPTIRLWSPTVGQVAPHPCYLISF